MGKICAHLSLLLIFYNNTHPNSNLYIYISLHNSNLYIYISLHIKRVQKVNYDVKKCLKYL